MERAYIDWVRVESFRCVREADIHLTPLHALIGPNDSGKSSLLHAIVGGYVKTRFWSTALGAGWRPGNEYSDNRYPGWGLKTSPIPEHLRQGIYDLCNPRAILRLDP